MKTKYLHTMVRVKDLDASMRFYELLGLKEIRRIENDKGRFTLVFMAPEGQEEAPVELTYNWDGDEGLPSDSRHFGHLAYEVENIYAMCDALQNGGGHDQPAAARRAHGLRAQPRQRLDRAPAGGRRRWRRRSRGRAWRTPGTGEGRGATRAGCAPRLALAALAAARAGGGRRLPAGAVAGLDVSSSVDAREYRLQTGGWRRRWWRPRCAAAFLAAPGRR